jgi:hypothetical protein
MVANSVVSRGYWKVRLKEGLKETRLASRTEWRMATLMEIDSDYLMLSRLDDLLDPVSANAWAILASESVGLLESQSAVPLWVSLSAYSWE